MSAYTDKLASQTAEWSVGDIVKFKPDAEQQNAEYRTFGTYGAEFRSREIMRKPSVTIVRITPVINPENKDYNKYGGFYATRLINLGQDIKKQEPADAEQNPLTTMEVKWAVVNRKEKTIVKTYNRRSDARHYRKPNESVKKVRVTSTFEIID